VLIETGLILDNPGITDIGRMFWLDKIDLWKIVVVAEKLIVPNNCFVLIEEGYTVEIPGTINSLVVFSFDIILPGLIDNTVDNL